MVFIQLNIKEPKHNASLIVKETPVTIKFEGTVDPLPKEIKDTLLYYRWYSSSVARLSKDKQGKPKVDGYSMNEPALTNLDKSFEYDLEMGSHVITLAVSDCPGETDEDFKAIQHGGVTGGRSGDHPCIIHVFKANIISPANDDHVSSSALFLKAEAPAEWDAKHEEKKDKWVYPYQEINQLVYHWKLEPLPLGDSSRPIFESGMLMWGAELEFGLNSDKKPTVTYKPVLLPTSEGEYKGKYRITLSVVDKNSPKISQGATASVDITLE